MRVLAAAFLLTLLLFTLLLATVKCVRHLGSSGPYSCKSPSGENVDWWVAYKLPQMEGAPRGTSLNKGTAFLYADSNSASQWTISKEPIDSGNSAIGLTAGQLFAAKRSAQHLYALYNDEHPDGPTDFNRAHAKGMLVSDEAQGFWLIHSVPNFPSTKMGSYLYPFTGKKFGQSFLCITTSASSLNDIGKQLFYAQPSWFEKKLPSGFEHKYPELALAMSGRAPGKQVGDFSSVQELRTLAGQSFISFSKHKKWSKDLYMDLVAPQLHSSLYVETWLNGGKDLPSECETPNKVYNLRSVRPANYKFHNSKDHSKWAVSGAGTPPWTCIGDINRQLSQAHRGGGTVCSNHPAIAALYRQAMGDVECCGAGCSPQHSSGRTAHAERGGHSKHSHHHRGHSSSSEREHSRSGGTSRHKSWRWG